MQIVYRDIMLHRTNSGQLEPVKFGPSYSGDVATLDGTADLLLGRYKVANTPESNALASELRQVLAIMPKLPNEGDRVIAIRDVADFSAIMNKVSNPNNPVLNCPL